MVPIALTVIFDVVGGLIFLGIAWSLADKLEPPIDATHRLLVEILAFFAGLLIGALIRFEIFVRDNTRRLSAVENEVRDMSRSIKGIPVLGAAWQAMQVDNQIILELVTREQQNYMTLLKDAGEGRLTIRSAQPRTIVNYSDFFAKLGDGAIVKAVTVVLPTPGFERVIIAANNNFISQRRGKVTRIFVMSKTASNFSDWENHMREQKAAGVSVRCLFTEDLPAIPVEDVLITDKPRMATRADVDIVSNTYKGVTLITEPGEVQILEDTWQAIFDASTAYP